MATEVSGTHKTIIQILDHFELTNSNLSKELKEPFLSHDKLIKFQKIIDLQFKKLQLFTKSMMDIYEACPKDRSEIDRSFLPRLGLITKKTQTLDEQISNTRDTIDYYKKKKPPPIVHQIRNKENLNPPNHRPLFYI